MNNTYWRAVAAALAFALILTGCQGPVANDGPVPAGAKNSVTIKINPKVSRSGLIDVSTASLRSDVYDIILYNASNTYRTVVSSAGTAATLTNVIPATYGVLVMAGKSNGATSILGAPAAVVLGTGDIPYLPSGPVLTGVAAELDGRGVTVAPTGNTAISVTLQNIVYSIASTGTGSNPYTVGIGNAFDVEFSYDLFFNSNSATNAVANSVAPPVGYANLGAANQLTVTGAAPTFVSTTVTGLASTGTLHPLKIKGSFTAPATSGTSTFSLNTGGMVNGGSAYTGMVLFHTAANSLVFFNTLQTQSGTPYNWYLPSDALTVAMPAIKDVNNVAVPGAATVNFSAPGAEVTVGWGAGL